MILFWQQFMSQVERLREFIFHRHKIEEPRRPAQEVFAQLVPLTGRALLESQPVKNVIAYANNWEPLIVGGDPQAPQEPGVLRVDPRTKTIALPNDFVTAANRIASPEDVWGAQQFDWDTYFINRGLLVTGRPEYRELARGQIDNLQYLFERFGRIPNGSSIDLSNRSQPPLLTSMIFDIYDLEQDKQWLQEKIAFAKDEYSKVWMLTRNDAKREEIRGQTHRIDNSTLGVRYVGGDIEKDPYAASCDSGRDDTEAWARRAYSIQPVDLHCFLYKEELDFAKAARILGNEREAKQWDEQAAKRKAYINEKFWDEENGWFFNYDERRQKKDSSYWDLHGILPLWAGVADAEQAAKMIGNLPRFEAEFGLRMAPPDSLLSQKERERLLKPTRRGSDRMKRFGPTIDDMTARQQWDGNNMWTPSMIFAWEGLDRYGYRDDALRIAEKSLRSFSGYYAEKGTLSEKRNAESGLNGNNHHYAEGAGFGLTMAQVLIEQQFLLSHSK